MSEVIFGESSGIYRLDGERIFHDESKVWEETLQDANNPSVPFGSNGTEWSDWWNAEVDIQVDPKSFEREALSSKFQLKDATLKPRFQRMTKHELKSWLDANGFRVPNLNSITRNQMIARAEYVWLGKI